MRGRGLFDPAPPLCRDRREDGAWRYLAEFDFRYNRCTVLKWSDAERAEDLLRNARDKRLTGGRLGAARGAWI